MKTFILYFLFLSTTGFANQSKYPVDISYVVADLKYSQEHGVKICEIQHGILSVLRPDAYLNGNNLISHRIRDFLSNEFPMKKWSLTNEIACHHLRKTLKDSPDWTLTQLYNTLINRPNFVKCSNIPPEDPFDIASYQGLIFVRPTTIKDFNLFRQNHPGIIIMGASTFPYWVDKYKMSLLFNYDPLLKEIKPEWNLYSKKYTPTLAQEIINEIPSEYYVIKPRGSFLGIGVIIVIKEDLDSTLEYILTKSNELKKDPDNSYNYWYRDTFDSFIIEKFYPSDLIQVEALDNQFYQPTMRIVFIMIYNRGKIDIKYLGGYWSLPIKPADANGTPNEVKKSICKLPYYASVKEETLLEAQKKLEVTMPLLYQLMLEER